MPTIALVALRSTLIWEEFHFGFEELYISPPIDHSIEKRFLIEYGITCSSRQAIWVDLHGHASDFAVINIVLATVVG